MTTRRWLAAAIMPALMITAMPGGALAQEEAALQPAEGVRWQLDALLGDGALADVPADVEVTLLLSEGDVTGSAGCNSYFGTYVIDATSLSFPDPFAVTQAFCEGAAQETEDAYLPLLSDVSGWAIDAEGALNLFDAAGTVTLVYSEPPVEIKPTDIEDLAAALEMLQAQVVQAEQDIAALAEATAVEIGQLEKRVKANEEAIVENEEAILEMETTIGKLRNRINNLEDAVAEIETTIGKFRNRINKLEDTAEDHEARLLTLELLPAAGQPAP